MKESQGRRGRRGGKEKRRIEQPAGEPFKTPWKENIIPSKMGLGEGMKRLKGKVAVDFNETRHGRVGKVEGGFFVWMKRVVQEFKYGISSIENSSVVNKNWTGKT